MSDGREGGCRDNFYQIIAEMDNLLFLSGYAHGSPLRMPSVAADLTQTCEPGLTKILLQWYAVARSLLQLYQCFINKVC